MKLDVISELEKLDEPLREAIKLDARLNAYVTVLYKQMTTLEKLPRGSSKRGTRIPECLKEINEVCELITKDFTNVISYVEDSAKVCAMNLVETRTKKWLKLFESDLKKLYTNDSSDQIMKKLADMRAKEFSKFFSDDLDTVYLKNLAQKFAAELEESYAKNPNEDKDKYINRCKAVYIKYCRTVSDYYWPDFYDNYYDMIYDNFISMFTEYRKFPESSILIPILPIIFMCCIINNELKYDTVLTRMKNILKKADSVKWGNKQLLIIKEIPVSYKYTDDYQMKIYGKPTDTPKTHINRIMQQQRDNLLLDSLNYSFIDSLGMVTVHGSSKDSAEKILFSMYPYEEQINELTKLDLIISISNLIASVIGIDLRSIDKYRCLGNKIIRLFFINKYILSLSLVGDLNLKIYENNWFLNHNKLFINWYLSHKGAGVSEEERQKKVNEQKAAASNLDIKRFNELEIELEGEDKTELIQGIVEAMENDYIFEINKDIGELMEKNFEEETKKRIREQKKNGTDRVSRADIENEVKCSIQDKVLKEFIEEFYKELRESSYDDRSNICEKLEDVLDAYLTFYKDENDKTVTWERLSRNQSVSGWIRGMHQIKSWISEIQEEQQRMKVNERIGFLREYEHRLAINKLITWKTNSITEYTPIVYFYIRTAELFDDKKLEYVLVCGLDGRGYEKPIAFELIPTKEKNLEEFWSDFLELLWDEKLNGCGYTVSVFYPDLNEAIKKSELGKQTKLLINPYVIGDKAMAYVKDSDKEELSEILKQFYLAETVDDIEEAFENLQETFGEQYKDLCEFMLSQKSVIEPIIDFWKETEVPLIELVNYNIDELEINDLVITEAYKRGWNGVN